MEEGCERRVDLCVVSSALGKSYSQQSALRTSVAEGLVKGAWLDLMAEAGPPLGQILPLESARSHLVFTPETIEVAAFKRH